jgi:hypothetical protein
MSARTAADRRGGGVPPNHGCLRNFREFLVSHYRCEHACAAWRDSCLVDRHRADGLAVAIAMPQSSPRLAAAVVGHRSARFLLFGGNDDSDARLLAKRSTPSEGCLRRSGQRAPRRHRAVEGLFESHDQVLLRLGGDIEPAISVGEAFCVDEALLTRPREIRGR